MNNSFPNLSGIKNIVFDFGRVLLNINPLLTSIALGELGYRPQDERTGGKDDEIVIDLEKGKISPDDFINEVLKVLKEGVTREDVIKAWNVMLLDFPSHHVDMLKRLGEKYNLYLLSNSNQIHYDKYTSDFRNKYGFELNSMFKKAWYSFQVGVIKPEPSIFRHILFEGNLDPAETLFIDDTLMHVEAARDLGIRAYHLTGNDDISELI